MVLRCLLHRASLPPHPCGVDAVIVLNALTSLQVHDRALIKALLPMVEAGASKLNAVTIGHSFFAMGKLRVANTAVLKALCDRALEVITTFKIEEMSFLADALVKVGYNVHPVLQQMMYQIPNAVQTSHASTVQCGTLLTAISKLKLFDRQVSFLLLEQGMRALDSHATPNPSTLVGMLFSASRVGIVNKRHTTSVLKILAGVPALTYGQTTMMWYVASVTPPPMDDGDKLLHALFQHSLPHIATYSPRDIVSAFMGLMEHAGTEAQARVLLARSVQCIKTGVKMPLYQSSSIFNFCQKLSVQDPRQLRPLLEHISRSNFGIITAQEIRNLLNGFSFVPSDEFHTLEKISHAAPRVMEDATQRETFGCVHSVTRLAPVYHDDRLFGAVIGRAVTFLEVATMGEVTRMAYCLITRRNHASAVTAAPWLLARAMEVFPPNPTVADMYLWPRVLVGFKVPHEGILQHILRNVPRLVNEMDGITLVNVAGAIAAFSHVQSSEFKLLVEAVPRYVDTLTPWQCSVMCGALTALATSLDTQRPIHTPLLRQLVNRCHDLHTAHGARADWNGGGIILSAMARGKVLSAGYVHALADSLLETLPTAHHSQVCSAFSSLSKLRCHSRRVMDTLWAHYLATSAESQSGDFTTVISARAGHVRMFGTALTPAEIKTLGDLTTTLTTKLTPHEAIVVATGLGVMKCPSDKLCKGIPADVGMKDGIPVRRLYHGLYERVLTADLTKPFDAARMLWVMSHTGVRDATLLGKCTRVLEGPEGLDDVVAAVWALDAVVTMVGNKDTASTSFATLLALVSRRVCELSWAGAMPETLLQGLRGIVALDNGRHAPWMQGQEYRRVLGEVLARLTEGAHKVPRDVAGQLIKEIRAMYVSHLGAFDNRDGLLEALQRMVDKRD